MLTDALLNQLREARPEVEIETVEILSKPARAWQAGIWMIPALVIGDQRFLRIPTLDELLRTLDAAAKDPPIG